MRYAFSHYWVKVAISFFLLIAVLAVIIGTMKLFKRKTDVDAIIAPPIIGSALMALVLHLYMLLF